MGHFKKPQIIRKSIGNVKNYVFKDIENNNIKENVHKVVKIFKSNLFCIVPLKMHNIDVRNAIKYI